MMVSERSLARDTMPTVPAAGALTDGTLFAGQLSHLSTSVVDGALILRATLIDDDRPSGTTVRAPIRQLSAIDAFTRITLQLGPSTIPELGSVVDWNPIHLDVSAVPGSGNPGGNPLGAAHSDGGGASQGMAALLNRLLNGLGL
jgi:hypothetical protein